tara:strand:- start:10 stop:714 length:705 start_codon:yes stop_codon:yes gene_type:complete
MANLPSLSDYNQILSQKGSVMGSVSVIDEDEAEGRRSALESVKQFGEVKSYLSGKPILNKVLENLKKSTSKTVEKMGIDKEAVQSNFDAAVDSARGEAQSMIQQGRAAVSNVFTKAAPERTDTELDDFADVGHNTRPVAKPEADDEPDVDTGDVPRASLGDTVEADKTLVKGVGKGEVTGDIEEGVSILDGIPGADVVGLIAGVGATLYASFHHIQNPKSVDDIFISPQTGIDG